MSSAEIMLVPIVAALYYRSNHALTRQFLFQHHYFKRNLCASRFGQRLQAIPELAWQMVFHLFSQLFVQANKSHDYAIDSMSILVCQNARINRCRLFPIREPRYYEDIKPAKIAFSTGSKFIWL